MDDIPIESLVSQVEQRREALLARLAELAVQRAEIEAAIDLAARDAHTAGASWRIIGEALGMSQQGAHKRFAQPPAAP